MVSDTNPQMESLEQWCGPVFILAGVLLLGYAALSAIDAFTDVVPPSAFSVGYGGIALLVPVFGLLGLYPVLRDRTPRLSLAGVGAAVLSGVLTVVLLLWLVVTTLRMDGYPVVPADAPAWTAGALLLSFLLLAAAFLLFGLAGLRTAVFSRALTLLLLVPAAGWFGLIAANVLLPSGAYLSVLAYTPISVAMLAIGYVLRAESAPTDRAEPAPTEVRHG